MRRLATLAALAVMLSGCQQYVSSPFVGFGGFIRDTHTFTSNPNMPPGSAENIRRVQGQQVAADPLLTEPGNIWPGPPKAEPTLEDIIQQQQPDQTGGQPPGGSAPMTPQGAEPTRPPAGLPINAAPGNAAPGNAAPGNAAHGSAPSASAPSVGTKPAPSGGTSIVVPNGNGTSTVIAPDGSITTIPTPH